MAANISRECNRCNGTGTDLRYGNPGTCPSCAGSGEVIIGFIPLENGPTTNVFWSYKIWEATDTTEYQALPEVQQTNYNKIVHMGSVDLNESSNSRIVLWNLFGSGSTTRTNLLALLT